MRSVFFYINATKMECIQHLETHYLISANGWIDKNESVYISFYEDFDDEIAFEAWDQLNSQLGANDFICVSADISGRIPGDSEVQEFANHILGKFNGLAQDDYSDQLWTYDEIKYRKMKSGHCFFDYSRR